MHKWPILLLFFCGAIAFGGVYVSAPATAQGYFVKKEQKDKNTGFFGRLFGREKKEQEQETKNVVQERPSTLAKPKQRGTTADNFKIEPVTPTEPVYDYDHEDTFDMKAIMEEAIGKCTPEDRKAYEAFKQMQAKFDEDMEEMQKGGGKMPEGYKLPEGDDPEKYEELSEELTEEEWMEQLQPDENTMHGFLGQPGRMEQVMGVAARCADPKEESAKAKARRKAREEAKAKRAQ